MCKLSNHALKTADCRLQTAYRRNFLPQFAVPKCNLLVIDSYAQANGVSTPLTLAKAQSAVQRLRWTMYKLAKSKLTEGISRESIQKIIEHFWASVGQRRCKLARETVLAHEGQRAATDHTYHVVSNLAARDATGRLSALKASLTSVMGQNYVLGCKVGFATVDALLFDVAHHPQDCQPELSQYIYALSVLRLSVRCASQGKLILVSYLKSTMVMK